MKQKILRGLIRHRIPVLAVLLLLSVGAAAAGIPPRFNSSMRIWFRENDPTLAAYEGYLRRFRSDEVVVLGVFAEDVFSPETMAGVDRITRTAAEIPHVHRVRSISNLRVLESGAKVVPLMPSVPRDAAESAALRARILAHPLVAGNLVSDDGRAAAVLVELSSDVKSFDQKSEIVRSLREIAAREPVTVRMAGMPVLDDAFYRSSRRDFLVLGPAVAGLVLVLCFVLFRRISAAIVPLGVIVLTTLWTLGLMGLLGIPMNPISTTLVALLLAVGVGDSVHILSAYYRCRAEGLERNLAIERTLSELFVPCVFTSVTTVAGFLSLLATDLVPIRQFGVLAAAGVSFAFVLTFTLAPALLALLPASKIREGRLTDRWLGKLGRPTPAFKGAVLVGSLMLVGLAAWRIPKIPVGPNPLNYFGPHHPIRLDAEAIDRSLGGSISLDLLVTAPPGGLADPERLRRLEGLEQWLSSYDGITKTHSIVTLLKEIQRVRGRTGLPSSRLETTLILEQMKDTPEFRSLMQPDLATARITVRARLSRATELTKKLPEIEARVAREFPDDNLRVQATGYVKLITNMSDYLIRGQIRSFGIAFLVISVLMALLVRSVRLAALAMIPNLAPIVLGLAFMELMGITLSLGTVMIGSIAIGLVVDNTIHFLMRLRSRSEPLEAAVEKTLQETGRPILVTSAILAAGFAVLCLGSFAPSVNFGLVSSVVTILALLGDVVLLPVLLLVVRPRIGRNRTPNHEQSAPSYTEVVS